MSSGIISRPVQALRKWMAYEHFYLSIWFHVRVLHLRLHLLSLAMSVGNEVGILARARFLWNFNYAESLHIALGKVIALVWRRFPYSSWAAPSR